MEKEKDIKEYMQLYEWDITVVSPAQQQLTPNRDNNGTYDPEYHSVDVLEKNLYFTIAPHTLEDTIYVIDGKHFKDTSDFLSKLEQAFTAAKFPTTHTGVHDVLKRFESDHPYSEK